ncbi:segregation/condensation protein A [Virgibacillus phasianinus]|uniref:Segregation and condensation protein A n=1 Tax=Virgibacillus phasianinus TaxID=2017483 RepID=A0A220U569_9BACI|nr:segregation/condensation protein A [Virgibacillus phasianinus]ASK63298.1 segregation/condensation protein A [Virgibacillus phasianinus]
MNQAYQVKLDTFEGPLDLLLHLIKQYEVDIYDIPVATITEQYMQYIHTLQRLELNIASEYLVMAATLIALKSQMLLPNESVDEEADEYMEDPRVELMQRLIEYRKYKEAAETLRDKEVESIEVYTREPILFNPLEVEQPMLNDDTSIYDMLGALNKLFERKKWTEPLDTKVKRVDIPIEQRMTEILDTVKEADRGISFYDLFVYQSRAHIVVTFIAVLELMKTKQVYCEQSKHLELLQVFYMGDQ